MDNIIINIVMYSGLDLYLLLQVFVGGVSVVWVVEFLLEDRVRQDTVLHFTLQSYNNMTNISRLS